MTVDEKISNALDLTQLRFPDSPRIVSIDWEPYVDSSGEDSLRVSVTLGEETDEMNLSGENILQIKATIHESLQSQNIFDFPYVFFKKVGESLADEAE